MRPRAPVVGRLDFVLVIELFLEIVIEIVVEVIFVEVLKGIGVLVFCVLLERLVLGFILVLTPGSERGAPFGGFYFERHFEPVLQWLAKFDRWLKG